MHVTERNAVPVLGAVRRLQALTALGWSMGALADLTGQNSQTLQSVRMGRNDYISRTLDCAIRRIYDEFWNRDPREVLPGKYVSRALNTAKEQGWAPPIMWDDEALDDPDGRAWTEYDYWHECSTCEGIGWRPGSSWHPPLAMTRANLTVRCQTCKGQGIRPPFRIRENQIDMEDVRLLARSGETMENIARRLGVEDKSIYTRLHRSGERRLLLQIMRNGIQTANDVEAAEQYAREAAC